MKKLYFLMTFLVFGFIANAQVGINTTTPNAQLEIKSTNQATPANTDGIIIPKLNAFPTTNPTAAQDGMMVYLSQTVGVNLAGFYYWKNSSSAWISISNNSLEWYKESTTVSPTAITDDMYHTGNIAIGKTTADYPLDVSNTTQDIGIQNSSNFSTNSANDKIGFKNLMSNSTSNYVYGDLTTINNTGTGYQYGSYVQSYNNTTANSVGFTAELTSVGTGKQYGLVSFINGSSSGEQIGNRNNIFNTGNNSHYGTYNDLGGSGTGDHFANYNILSGTGTGLQYGNSTTITNSGNGFHFGNQTYLNGAGVGDHFANNSELAGTGNGQQTVNFNAITNNGSGTHYANLSNLGGTGTGAQFGNYTTISNSGNALHYGSLNVLTGTGTGNKFGTYNIINSSAGGLHYGLYSEVLKTNSFAGYFLGNVAIGTTTSNNYILPTSRGTTNQIIQTDGSGNATWVNATSLTISENDPQVSSATTNTIPKYNGTTLVDGVMIDNGTNVGVGITPTAGNKLEVAGKTKTSNLQVTTGATVNYILQSDAAGNGTWVSNQGGFIHYLGELYLGGVIYELYKGSDGLEHGLVVALTESTSAWQTTASLVNANRTEDGAFNTNLMINSPITTYISSLGVGWYLPSLDELRILYNNRYYTNKTLRTNGNTLLTYFSYWSSFELSTNSVAYLRFAEGNFGFESKSIFLNARGIKSF